MFRTTLTVLAAFSAAALLVLAVACGDDDDGEASVEEIAEFEDLVTRMVETEPSDAAQVTNFLDHTTEKALAYFGFESREECAANAEECIGDPGAVESISDTRISGDEASATVATAEGDILNVAFINEDDTWKLNGFALSAEIPEGVRTVDVSGSEYRFDWDPAEIAAGDVAFTFTNNGDELHELAIVAVTEEFDIEAVKEYAQTEALGEDDPPGTAAFVGFTLASPGLTGNAALEAPLEPGDYVFLCFLASPDGTPHVVLDMYSVFTVE